MAIAGQLHKARKGTLQKRQLDSFSSGALKLVTLKLLVRSKLARINSI